MSSRSTHVFFTTNYTSVVVRVPQYIVIYFFSDLKRCALHFRENLSNNQPVNFHLRPFRAFWDDVCTKTTWA